MDIQSIGFLIGVIASCLSGIVIKLTCMVNDAWKPKRVKGIELVTVMCWFVCTIVIILIWGITSHLYHL